jgi:MFS family permease
MLAAARIGVGVGEATASPAAYSLISDWFPKRLRATALAIYSAGIYLGGGFSMFIGGADRRGNGTGLSRRRPDGAGRLAGGVHGGRPARPGARAVGLRRCASRCAASPRGCHAAAPRAVQGFLEELLTIIPPFTLIGAARNGARRCPQPDRAARCSSPRVYAGLIRLGEPLPQWARSGSASMPSIAGRRRCATATCPTYALILGTPAFLAVVLAYGLNAFLAYAVAAPSRPASPSMCSTSPRAARPG